MPITIERVETDRAAHSLRSLGAEADVWRHSARDDGLPAGARHREQRHGRVGRSVLGRLAGRRRPRSSTGSRRSPSGQDIADRTIFARFERALHNFGRSGPYIYALAGARHRAVGSARQARRRAGACAARRQKARHASRSMPRCSRTAAIIDHVKRNIGARARTRLSPDQAAREDDRSRRGDARGDRARRSDHGRHQLRVAARCRA